MPCCYLGHTTLIHKGGTHIDWKLAEGVLTIDIKLSSLLRVISATILTGIARYSVITIKMIDREAHSCFGRILSSKFRRLQFITIQTL